MERQIYIKISNFTSASLKKISIFAEPISLNFWLKDFPKFGELVKNAY